MKVLGIFKEKCVFVFLGHSADSDVAMSPGRSKEHLFPESELHGPGGSDLLRLATRQPRAALEISLNNNYFKSLHPRF